MLQLEPFTTNYSGANAHALSLACSIVASPSWSEDHGMSTDGWVPQYVSIGSVRVLIASNNDAIVAAFHDAEDEPLDQWIGADGQSKASAPESAGFAPSSVNKRLNERFEQVWDKASKSLRAARCRSIFLTGHGLGGAYALLAALRLRASAGVLHGVYTFGQPRVLSRNLALWLDLDFGSHLFRVVNNNDLVTLCPFRKDGYGHAGTLVFFNSAGELHCDRYWWLRLLSEFDESVADELPRLLRVTPSGVRDHMIERYVELTLRHRDHGLRP